MISRSLHHHGVTLLIVLAAIVLTLPLAVALTRQAMSARTEGTLHRWSLIAEDLLDASEAAIEQWLVLDSNKIVLSESATTPSVAVLSDRWRDAEGTEHAAHITAWDQLGMVPLDATRNGSPLRVTLPDVIIRQIDAAAGLAAPAGLDEFADCGDGAVYPRESRSTNALGARIATHGHDRSQARINVNTAPLPLVELAMRLGQIDQLAIVVESRRAGRPARIASTHHNLGRLNMPRPPALVSESDTWAFRVDVEVGAIRRSRWMVFERLGSTWKVAQRLVISE